MNVDQKIQELESSLNGIQSELQKLKSYVKHDEHEDRIPFNEQRNETVANPQQRISTPIHNTPQKE